ncbi:hypothetical protein EZV62_011771 [Acer yangbiense]|uniref:Nodulin-like domain-containing protein n=1 Tax=Acer yangbiense TaxID=1000413 RepID=A0A5C7I6F7_9ROSI|nr:hypothetical protein EZV62_011771 [Acer yangbiense]
MAGLRDRRLGPINFRQQLHILQLLRRSQDADVSNPAPAQQLVPREDVGTVFGLLAGIASDRLPTPVILLIGSIQGLIGYGAQWLVVSKRIQPLPYWQYDVDDHGGAGDMHAKLPPESGPVCLPAVFFLREIPPVTTEAEEREETMYFMVFNAVAIMVAICLLGYDFVKTSGDAVSVALTVVLLVLLSSPLLIPFYSYLKTRNSTHVEGQNEEALLKPEKAAVKTTVATAEEVKRRLVIGEDHTIFEAMRTVYFWILFLSFLCGIGTGMAVMNNIGQTGLALGYVEVTTFVSLMSIFGFFGRIISGWLSEYFYKKDRTPRHIWNAASQILMAVGYMLLALDEPGSLYIGSIILGLCYGVRLAVIAPITELFGVECYGQINNILMLNIPLGSFLFSGLLAGYLYDTQATSIAGGGNTCVGAHCYRLVFTIMAIVCLVGFGLDIVLAFKTKHIDSKSQSSEKSSSAEDLTANEYDTA